MQRRINFEAFATIAALAGALVFRDWPTTALAAIAFTHHAFIAGFDRVHARRDADELEALRKQINEVGTRVDRLAFKAVSR